MSGEEYDPHGPIGDRGDNRGGAGDYRGAGEGSGNDGSANRGHEGTYGHDSGDDEEDMGFTMKMESQSLSSMPRGASTAAGERSSRSAPTAMKPFNASQPAASSVSGAPLTTMTTNSKVAASLAPLTTLGSSNRTSLPPNPAIGGLLAKSEESRFYTHLESAAMENYPDKPWEREGADLSDYFNYGFTEETWTLYRATQLALRKDNGYNERMEAAAAQGRSQSSNSGGRRDGRDYEGGRSGRTSARDDHRRGGRSGAAGGDRNDRRDDGNDSRNTEDDRRERSHRSDDRRGGSYNDNRDNRDERGGRRDGAGRDGGRDAGGRDEGRYEDRSGRRNNRSPDRDPRGDEDRKKPRR